MGTVHRLPCEPDLADMPWEMPGRFLSRAELFFGLKSTTLEPFWHLKGEGRITFSEYSLVT